MQLSITNPSLARVINKYWQETFGNMKFISECGYHGGIQEGVRLSEEAGASAMYYHGGYADSAVAAGNFDDIKKVLELIRHYGKPAEIGVHRLETVEACVAATSTTTSSVKCRMIWGAMSMRQGRWSTLSRTGPYGSLPKSLEGRRVMVRTKELKLIFFMDNRVKDKDGSLYLLVFDPGERVNLYNDPQYHEVISYLENLAEECFLKQIQLFAK